MSNSKDYDKRYARYQQITEDVGNAKKAAYDFLKSNPRGSSEFKDMLKKLTYLATTFGRYEVFFKIASCVETLHGYDMKFEEDRAIADITGAVGSVKNKIEMRKCWLERNKIISNAKFKATVVSEDSTTIKDVDIIVNAERNDIMIIKLPIPPCRKDRDIIDKKLWRHVGNEIFSIPYIFRLDKCKSKSGEYELSVEQMRIRSYRKGKKEGERYCEFHVEKGVLTAHKKNEAKMLRINIPKLLGNMQTGHRINTPFGTVGVERYTFGNRSPVGSIFIAPLEEETPDTWHSDSRKILRDAVPLMRFITAKSLEVSLEEHRHNDRSEFYFDKDIDKVYPVLANHGLEDLAKKIFKESREDGFTEDISKLAEAATIADTYSSSWKIRLICMIEALEVWGSHEKFKLLGRSFKKKLTKFFECYIPTHNSKRIEELNQVRNNLMHNGIATPVNFSRNDNKDKIYEQKDESKYYFFKFREVFVEIFLSELDWNGKHCFYSCSKDGTVTRTEEKR